MHTSRSCEQRIVSVGLRLSRRIPKSLSCHNNPQPWVDELLDHYNATGAIRARRIAQHLLDYDTHSGPLVSPKLRNLPVY